MARANALETLGIGPSEISPEGRVKAQVNGAARTVALPGTKVDALGVEQSDEFIRAYHPESDTFLFVPIETIQPKKDHWAVEFL
jgi:hypothetical protein